ncbi:MAG: undecaprenyl/decaprenyl-phosphate alpha-N-acetylglucosaminyl 1-phosphate transferase [Lentisphaeria bacterium]|nr:undecaprenyl/decaprenyl-phosphate alpha-N-acetylglucosaminyl 1-phosphate transferase [Lentisphaeria bacterium]
MSWIYIYIAVFIAASITAFITTLIFKKLSWKLNFLDVPMKEGHKLHEKATPLLGGMAMLSAWLLVAGGGIFVSFIAPDSLPELVQPYIQGIKKVSNLFIVIASGAVALAIMGLLDDKKPMGWKAKLSLQCLICLTVIFLDSYLLEKPRIRITLFHEQPIITWVLTLGWFLFIINAFNFFDNMDGLAAGLAFIASLLFASVAAMRDQHFVASLAVTTAGISLGYYFWNKYPAKIFMGDCGSHFLGYLLAVQGTLPMFYTGDSATVAPVLIPLMVLSLPIFDTFAVSIIRIRLGKAIWIGDHNHISHRFLKMGMSKKVAVMTVHLLSLIMGLSGVLLLFAKDNYAVSFVLLQILVIMILICVLHSVKNGDKNGSE